MCNQTFFCKQRRIVIIVFTRGCYWRNFLFEKHTPGVRVTKQASFASSRTSTAQLGKWERPLRTRRKGDIRENTNIRVVLSCCINRNLRELVNWSVFIRPVHVIYDESFRNLKQCSEIICTDIFWVSTVNSHNTRRASLLTTSTYWLPNFNYLFVCLSEWTH